MSRSCEIAYPEFPKVFALRRTEDGMRAILCAPYLITPVDVARHEVSELSLATNSQAPASGA